MLINPKSIATVLVLATCLGTTIRVANGAELRSSLGQREVSRQLQHQTETVDLEPIYDEEELLGDSGSCDLGCGGCGICDDCLTLRGTWVDAEYLLWWRRGTFTPPLVTTSPLGTPQADAGIDPAIVLFGDQTIGRDAKPGGRITIGHWLGSCHIYSVEGRYFSLGDSTTHFSTNSDINPIIARPFFNTDPAVNANDAELIAFANAAGTVTTGTVDVMDQSEVMGVDVYLRRLWCRTPCWQIDLLAGYQFSRIDESLQFNSFTNDGQGVTLSVQDLFATENEFHGGQIGVEAQLRRGCWTLELLAKLGLGQMSQRVAISGQRVTMAGGQVESFDSGLFAQSLTGNTGVFEQNDFNIVPEFGIKLSYAITPCLSINFGGSLIFWNSVLLPADQIDFSVDGRLLDSPDGPIIPPPPTHPVFNFNTSDYYVHGISAGLEYRF